MEAQLSVLVYDGDCGFCTSWAERVEPRLEGQARVVSWQDLGLDGLAEHGLSLEDVGRASWWVDPDGSRFGGPKSVAKVLLAVGGPWHLLGRAMLVPPVSWLAAAVYAVVVRLRHRLPGATPACDVRTR
jgi:predicted DCC family thiol-disulfide oxidoreductase YuxK